MKIVRFKDTYSQKIHYGIIINDKIFYLKNSPYNAVLRINKKKNIKLKEEKLLSPCDPNKIIALALNYIGLKKKKQFINEPLIFIKSKNTICKSNTKIKIAFNLPTWGESELGFVIKKQANNVNIREAKKYILGYLPVNDITCKNIHNRDDHLARSKSADCYCPVGEYIDTEYDYKNKIIESYHNKILLRRGTTNDMIWYPEKIISFLSKWMTLMPGDLIITGAPPRIRKRIFLKKGDSFNVKIEGFKELKNYFI